MTHNYARDGRCHAVADTQDDQNPNNECLKPATQLGETHRGFLSGFCDDCRQKTREGHEIKIWRHIPRLIALARPTDNLPP